MFFFFYFDLTLEFRITVFSLRVRLLRTTIRQNQFGRRRTTNRTHPRRQQIDNVDTLNRISNLPPQRITDDPLIDQFFNGSSFNT
jgi:hypothetical protein